MWLFSALVQKNLPEAKWKSYGLTALVEDIPKSQALTVVSLLVGTLGNRSKEKHNLHSVEREGAGEV